WSEIPSVCAAARVCIQSSLFAWTSGFQMTPTRAVRGRVSLSSSSRFIASSGEIIERPVTLPPGRPRLATSPAPTGSPADGHDDRDRVGRALCGADRWLASSNDHVNPAMHQVDSEVREPLQLAFSPPVLERDVLAFAPAELPESFCQLPDNTQRLLIWRD